MKITIHRGTNEIGGSCVVIEHEGTRLLLDAGAPLDDSPASLPADIDLCDGVLISHSHQDHYGLINQLPTDVPLYIGKIAWNFIQGVSFFKPGGELLPHTPIHIEAGKRFQIGTISILPYLVDHSSPDAYGFLLEAGGKHIYYSGDFRAHGRKEKTFDYLCKRLPKEIDAMLLEGTMVKRDNTKCASERDVEEEILKAAKAEPGLVCLSFSAQNIDRLVSVYMAAKRCNRLFVTDIYTAWIMRVAHERWESIPDINRKEVRVLEPKGLGSKQYFTTASNTEYFGAFSQEIYRKDVLVTADDLAANPSKYMVKLSDGRTGRVLDQTGVESSTVIYSQWAGYLEKGTPNFNKSAARLRDRKGSTFKMIHTSGHAVLDDLKRLVDSTKPKVVIPLHTEYKDQYDEHFPSVHVLEDMETFEI